MVIFIYSFGVGGADAFDGGKLLSARRFHLGKGHGAKQRPRLCRADALYLLKGGMGESPALCGGGILVCKSVRLLVEVLDEGIDAHFKGDGYLG